ncbi:MAG TPA: tRNA 2-selenouridine(34) synthase MnmH [Burkholderiales bacterium]|nr:tRNA 2-selenouridine(34) synthase MnmH [Burkholderiales bacterium]
MKPAMTHSVAMQASVLAAHDAIIDARSPAEYAEDHLPGAISLPVLEDAERARVGTLYKQVSPFAARRLGAALVARNIARHLEGPLAAHPKGWRPLVYCWRGGKRSGAFVHVLREVGWDAHALAGGYKSYRRFVVEELARLPREFTFRVIQGATGSGKSRLLRALAQAGAQVLDLEALAAHRGSVLGDLPGRPQPSQKAFESQVLAQLARLERARPVFVEGESRKIGQLQVPEALIERMRAADCLMLEASTATRVALLMDEYRHFFADPATLCRQLDCLVPLHGRARIEEWKALAADNAWEALVARLLEEHYDPAYRRSAQRNFARLPRAREVRVQGPETSAFEALAGALVADREEAVAAVC